MLLSETDQLMNSTFMPGTELPRIFRLERSDHLLHLWGTEFVGGYGNLDFLPLPFITHECSPPGVNCFAGRTGFDDLARRCRHLFQQRVNLAERKIIGTGRKGPYDLIGNRRVQEPDRRANAGIHRYHDCPDADLVRNSRSMKGTVAAEGHHGES